MADQQGPQNTVQFFTLLIKSVITGLPQMLKSIIITSSLSFITTLTLHFLLILYPNDGYNSGSDPLLNTILVLANINPTPPNVHLFWFLANYLFWWIIGTVKERGVGGTIKQLATTPLFLAEALKESGISSFPMLMGGLAFAFTLRLWILGTMTTLQMLLMMTGVLVSQHDSIMLIGLRLMVKDIKAIVNRGTTLQTVGFGQPVNLVLGAVIGFAYLIYFPYDVQMVQILAGLMILGLIGLFIQGRKKGPLDQVALALMLICIFTLTFQYAKADDGGAAESYGAINVVKNGPLRDKMIKQGISPALAGIAAALAASGKLTPNIFNLLKTGKVDPSKLTKDEVKTIKQIANTMTPKTPTKQKPSTLKTAATWGADILTSFTPGVNDARDWYELTTGKDLVHGDDIGTFGRVMAGIGLIAGSGVVLRKGGGLIKKGFKKIGSVISTGGGYLKKWAGKGWDVIVSVKNKFRKPRIIPKKVPRTASKISDGIGGVVKVEKGVPVVRVTKDTPVYRQISGGVGDPNTKKILNNIENGKTPGDYLPRGGDGAKVKLDDVGKYDGGVPPKDCGVTATTTSHDYAKQRAKKKGDLIIEADLPKDTPTFGKSGGLDGENQLLVNKIKNDHITRITRSDGKGGFELIYEKGLKRKPK